MRSIPVDEVVRLAEYFVNQDWPLTREQGYAACEALGWPGTGDGGFVMPYGLNMPEASVIVGKEEGGVTRIYFRVTDVQREAPADEQLALNDLFVSYVDALRAVLGRGKTKKSKEDHEATWDTSNGAHIELVNNWRTIRLYVFSPSYVETLRYLGKAH
ncbi:MAG: DUF6301 family protein [Propionibacteriaceae bacterium]|nr:DUF6301 family protein [Propionibacteriaceae bacterium]